MASFRPDESPPQSLPHVILSGPITAGKSTFALPLARALGVPAYLELPETNPFFGAPDQRAFDAEVFFLAACVESIRSVARGGGGVVERSPGEHVRVFAQGRHDHGWLSRPELELLSKLEEMLRAGPEVCPDLLVFLDVPPEVIPHRVAGRGVPEESSLELSYLRTLDRLYRRFRESWAVSPVYYVDTTTYDLRTVGDQTEVIERIRARLNELR